MYCKRMSMKYAVFFLLSDPRNPLIPVRLFRLIFVLLWMSFSNIFNLDLRIIDFMLFFFFSFHCIYQFFPFFSFLSFLILSFILKSYFYFLPLTTVRGMTRLLWWNNYYCYQIWFFAAQNSLFSLLICAVLLWINH